MDPLHSLRIFKHTLEQSPRARQQQLVTSKFVGSQESKYFETHFQPPTQINCEFPKNMSITSKVHKESLYAVRQSLRLQLIDHSKYNPQLETPHSKLLLQDVYIPNVKPDESKLTKPVQQFIKERGSYKHCSVNLRDRFVSKSSQQPIEPTVNIKKQRNFDSLWERVRQQQSPEEQIKNTEIRNKFVEKISQKFKPVARGQELVKSPGIFSEESLMKQDESVSQILRSLRDSQQNSTASLTSAPRIRSHESSVRYEAHDRVNSASSYKPKPASRNITKPILSNQSVQSIIQQCNSIARSQCSETNLDGFDHLHQTYQTYTDQFNKDPLEIEHEQKFKDYAKPLFGFEQIEAQIQRAQEFEQSYFTGQQSVRQVMEANPAVIKVMVKQQRNKKDNTWKPNKMAISRELRTFIEAKLSDHK